MRIPCAIALLLLATACDRGSPSKAIETPAVAPAPSAAAPAVVQPAASAKSSKAAGPSKSASGKRTAAVKPSSPSAARDDDGSAVADDPCAGLDGSELDDCLGFDAADQGAGDEDGNDQASRDFAAEQERRDRELLERDADEAAYLDERDAADFPLEEEFVPPEDDDYDEPPEDDAGW